ncbi:MAG: phosphoglycolate phosphatase [Sterolibacterium sp.]|nr:phosphoglycolate phosphatase [Sterolibacterium sp.]MBP9798989.1 phosphoglycolate phosphatase [Sterolibacterium sp.]
MIKAVLFDLDGTLADTAPGLAQALNCLLQEEGRAVLPLAVIRPHASNGTRGLLKLGLGVTPEGAGYPELARRFLDHYAVTLGHEVSLFPGVPALLEALEARSLAWGVVTNKPHRFTLPLVEQLGLAARCACVVSGDSTPYPKPDPAPLLLACQQAGVAPEYSLYVGDDQRDIVAGRAAGMRTVAVTWGYLGVEVPPAEWQADALVSEPAGILALL